MKNSKIVLIDRNPGRNSQTYGIARELNTDVDLIHEPSVGVLGNKGDSQCYVGVSEKVLAIHEQLRSRVGKEDKKLVVALDVGTSKIVVIVAELQEDGVLKIIGLGQHLSKGLKKGVVINIDSTMQAIQRAVEEAELMADCKIKDVYTGIAGSHIRV